MVICLICTQLDFHWLLLSYKSGLSFIINGLYMRITCLSVLQVPKSLVFPYFLPSLLANWPIFSELLVKCTLSNVVNSNCPRAKFLAKSNEFIRNVICSLTYQRQRFVKCLERKNYQMSGHCFSVEPYEYSTI